MITGNMSWLFLQLGGPILESLCEGSYYFGSILGAPDFGKSHTAFVLKGD